MLSRFFTLLTLTTVLAAQAIAGLAHVHDGPVETSSPPHIHLSGGHHHGHAHHDHHGHGHHHHGGHHHDGEDRSSESQDGSTEIYPLPVCDLAIVITPEVLLSPPNTKRFETTMFVLNLSFGGTVEERLPDSFVAKPSRSRFALAHAPILNKIRLLL